MVSEQRMNKTTSDNPWEDLVLSILSVSKYPLEKTYRIVDRLRKEGLFDPRHLTRWDHSEITDRLKSAGYDRGTFMTGQLALRLSNLGTLIEAKGVETCNTLISSRDTGVIEELLLPVKGIGPNVLATFYLLREIPRRQ